MLVTVLPQEELKRQVSSGYDTVPTDLAFFLTVPHNWSSNDHKVPLVKAQLSLGHLVADKSLNNNHLMSCIFPVKMSDRQMSASHPLEVKNCF